MLDKVCGLIWFLERIFNINRWNIDTVDNICVTIENIFDVPRWQAKAYVDIYTVTKVTEKILISKVQNIRMLKYALNLHIKLPKNLVIYNRSKLIQTY